MRCGGARRGTDWSACVSAEGWAPPPCSNQPDDSGRAALAVRSGFCDNLDMPTAAPPPVAILKGGEWLLTATAPDAVFTPEQLTDEHRLIAQTVTDFVNAEVLPVLDRLEQKDWALAREL